MTRHPDFEDVVRRSLHQAADATRPAPDLAARLLADPGNPDRTVVPLRHRRAVRWTLPLVAAAAVAAVVVGAVELTPTSSPAPPAHSGSVAPTHSPTSTPSPVPTPTTPSVPGPDSVPPHFRTEAADFTDATHGWVLGDARCPTGTRTDCATLARTTDGGRHWRRMATPARLISTFDSSHCVEGPPGPCVNQLQFANARDGYLWGGPDFYWTKDGGRHWTRETHPLTGTAGNDDLVVIGSTALRLAPTAQCSSPCTVRMERAPVGTAAWTFLTPPGGQLSQAAQLQVYGGRTYLFGTENGATRARNQVLLSGDAGRTWSTITSDPCVGGGLDEGTVAPDGRLVLLCENDKGSELRTTPAGSTRFGPLRSIPGPDGSVTLESVRSGGKIIVSCEPTSVPGPTRYYATTNGGRTWTRIAKLPPDADTGFTTDHPQIGWSVGPGTRLDLTTDGGQNWISQTVR